MIFHPLILVMAAALGACVGSFLNVVIHRVPRDMSVHEPKRSFCPSCKYQIPWYLNLPIVSWIFLRGKCANCGTKISVRYVLVEALVGALFLAAWICLAPVALEVVLFSWVLISLLVAASFIDFEHYIIPDGLNFGGMVVGLTGATLVPQMVGELIWWKGLLASVIGAVVGFALLWTVVQLGKLAFGRKVHKFDKPVRFKIHQPDPEKEPQVEIADDIYPWSDIYGRPSDRLEILCSELKINGEERKEPSIIVFYNRVEIGGETIGLENVEAIEGMSDHIVQPREAMGFGDVKFVAMIGAFLGWQAAVFSLIGGAILGSVIGVVQKAVGGEKWSKPIPFGPYLALGALIFLFYGPDIVGWYLDFAGLR